MRAMLLECTNQLALSESVKIGWWRGAEKVCGCVSKAVEYNQHDFLYSSALGLTAMGEGPFLLHLTYLVKSADPVSLGRLSAVVRAVFCLYQGRLSYRAGQDIMQLYLELVFCKGGDGSQRVTQTREEVSGDSQMCVKVKVGGRGRSREGGRRARGRGKRDTERIWIRERYTEKSIWGMELGEKRTKVSRRPKWRMIEGRLDLMDWGRGVKDGEEEREQNHMPWRPNLFLWTLLCWLPGSPTYARCFINKSNWLWTLQLHVLKRGNMHKN